MKQVFCIVALAGAVLAEEFSVKSANSFLRSKRATQGKGRELDDTVLNYREEWENFKDGLEKHYSATNEKEVDILEACISTCRKNDWWFGTGFSELREAYSSGKTNVRPIPCNDSKLDCCKKVPTFVWNAGDARLSDKKFNVIKVFNDCMLPKCDAGTWGNSASRSCEECPKGTFSANSGSRGCENCAAGTYSEIGDDSCRVCEANTYSANAGSERCTACALGSSSESGATSCTANECNCANGFAAEGAQCTENGATQCNSCEDGYYKDSNECFENVCECDNGDAPVGADCFENGANVCTNCESGHQLNSGACVAVCECDDGTAHEGDDCSTGEEGCASCDGGYFHDSDWSGVGTCTENVCYCDNGDEATGDECTENDANICSECDDNYRSEGGNVSQECVANVCQCSMGTGADDGNCPNHGDDKCVSCDVSYELSGDECIPEPEATEGPGFMEGGRGGPSDGDAQIVPNAGSSNQDVGRLEVYHCPDNGDDCEWGNVCNDEFGPQDAAVACRMMGYDEGRTVLAKLVDSGARGSRIWLDNLRCRGNEESLFDCPRGPANAVVGKHNCGHSEDIGVSCSNN